MLNVFYCYGIIWIVILLLYYLGWSDLCVPLDKTLFIFIIVSIIITFLIGYIFRKNLKYRPLKENKHKKPTITILFLAFFILEILLERQIPLMNVLRGYSYDSVSFKGINGLHTIISALAIAYSFYLSYIYASFKEKKILYELGLIISYFILLVQRQNILICIVGFLNIIYASNSSRRKKNNSRKHNRVVLKKIIIAVLILVMLYGFGIMGNMRYGSNWKWNDSSMIRILGRENEKYPSFIPEEYFWSYVYMVTPLVNLNANVDMYTPQYNSRQFFPEFITEIISNKLEYKKEQVYLPVSSLTASTSYVRVYRSMGYLGIGIMYMMQMLVSITIIVITIHKNKDYLVVNCMCILYFLVFSFFENTFVYATSSIILMFALMNSLKYRLK